MSTRSNIPEEQTTGKGKGNWNRKNAPNSIKDYYGKISPKNVPLNNYTRRGKRIEQTADQPQTFDDCGHEIFLLHKAPAQSSITGSYIYLKWHFMVKFFVH